MTLPDVVKHLNEELISVNEVATNATARAMRANQIIQQQTKIIFDLQAEVKMLRDADDRNDSIADARQYVSSAPFAVAVSQAEVDDRYYAETDDDTESESRHGEVDPDEYMQAVVKREPDECFPNEDDDHIVLPGTEQLADLQRAMRHPQNRPSRYLTKVSNADRERIVRESMKMSSMAKGAEHFNVAKSTLTTWKAALVRNATKRNVIAHTDEGLGQGEPPCDTSTDVNGFKWKGRSGAAPKYPKLEAQLGRWIHSTRKLGKTARRAQIRAKALQLARHSFENGITDELMASYENFQASHNWVVGAIKRYEISVQK